MNRSIVWKQYAAPLPVQNSKRSSSVNWSTHSSCLCVLKPSLPIPGKYLVYSGSIENLWQVSRTWRIRTRLAFSAPNKGDVDPDDRKVSRSEVEYPEVEYITPEQISEDDEEGLTSYFNDVSFDNTVREALSLQELAELRNEGLRKGLGQENEDVQEAVFVAGFRPEELPLLQASLQTKGLSGESCSVKLIPATDEVLSKPVLQALQAPPVPWNTMLQQISLGRGWGAKRVLLFSGFSIEAQAAAVELLHDMGITDVTPGQVDHEDASIRVGDALASAVQTYRDALRRKRAGQKPIWEEEEEEGSRGADREALGGDPRLEVPVSPELRSDDPHNLANAVRDDGTLDPNYMKRAMDRAKAEMLAAAREKGLDLDLAESADESATAKDDGENGMPIGSTTAVDPRHRGEDPGINQASHGHTEAATAHEISAESSSGSSATGSDGGSCKDLEKAEAALESVRASFRRALKEGIPMAEIEALVDDAYGHEALRGGEDTKALGSPGVAAGSDREPTEEDASVPARVITKTELRKVAEKHSLDFDALVRNAEQKGVELLD